MEFENLKSSGLLDALSDTARDIYLPQGIFFWSKKAKAGADINATIGSAQGKASHFLPGGGEGVKTFYLPSVIEALRNIDAEKIVAYAGIEGNPDFRAAWRKWVVEKLRPHYEFDDALLGTPVVVPGATAGIYYLSRLFLSPGDSIICHDRHWENYDLIFQGTQGVRVETAPLFSGAGMDVDAIVSLAGKTAARQRAAVVIMNFPNNPTGYMPTIEEGRALRAAFIAEAEKTGGKFILIFDDAYEGYVYEKDAAPVSLFGHFVGAHPGIIPVKCDGATKEFLLYGARTACVTFAYHPAWGEKEKLEKEMENKFCAFIRGSVSNCNHSAQAAVAEALKKPETIAAERKRIIDVLAERYFALKKELAAADLPGAEADPFNSGFFCSINLKTPADELAENLIANHKLGVIPMVNEKLGINAIRLAFCSVELEKINEMAARLSRALKA